MCVQSSVYHGICYNCEHRRCTPRTGNRYGSVLAELETQKLKTCCLLVRSPVNATAACSDAMLVYTLGKAPRLLPILRTPDAVLPILMGGADLMAPGGSRKS